MLRNITIRQYTTRQLDMQKIRSVANNPELDESQVFDFGTFIIARSGRNHNNTEITADGQKAAVEQWIGKAILFEDHKLESPNQIGRIYDAWVDKQDGETVTLGRGFGIVTDDHKDLFSRIKNRIHSELSCGYEPVRSLCSLCEHELDLSTNSCPQGHGIGMDGFYARDVEFMPNHLSFTANPAVEGAGLVAASRTNSQHDQLTKDGETFRTWACKEFITWYKRNNPTTSDDETKNLANRLSAKEMLTFARVEESKFRETLGSGKQLSVTTKEDEQEELITFKDIKDIYQNRSK